MHQWVGTSFVQVTSRRQFGIYSISQEICTRLLLCCGYTLTDFPISIRLTSLALWQSNDCPSASKATLMNMDEYFMWIHYERLHNHNKAKHNKTVCIILGIYCMHYLILCGFVNNCAYGNKLQCDLIQDKFLLTKMHLRILSAKFSTILFRPQCVADTINHWTTQLLRFNVCLYASVGKNLMPS